MKLEDTQPEDESDEVQQLSGLKRSHTGMYYGIALDALGMAEKAFKIGNDAVKHNEGSTSAEKDEHIVRILVATRARQQYVATVIVFSSLCAEALINFALDAKLSKFFVVGLDKLDTPTKWVVGLKLGYSHDLKCDAPLVHSLKKLAALRNRRWSMSCRRKTSWKGRRRLPRRPDSHRQSRCILKAGRSAKCSGHRS